MLFDDNDSDVDEALLPFQTKTDVVELFDLADIHSTSVLVIMNG